MWVLLKVKVRSPKLSNLFYARCKTSVSGQKHGEGSLDTSADHGTITLSSYKTTLRLIKLWVPKNPYWKFAGKFDQ